MFFIDIAVPRDVDPAMNKLEGIFVYDIDDLQAVAAAHMAERSREASDAETLIAGEVERFHQHQRTANVAPAIVALQRQAEEIRQLELRRVQARLGSLSAEQIAAVEMLTRGLVNKLLHPPMQALKQAAREGDSAGWKRCARPGRFPAPPLQRPIPTLRLRSRAKLDLPKKRELRPLASPKLGWRYASETAHWKQGFQLALWQANHIAALLREQGHEVEIEIIKTTGDRLQEITFAQVGSKGMFTKEIEEALAEGRVDLAVHSLKDLPTELPALFTLAATPPRIDPRDAFVSVI